MTWGDRDLLNSPYPVIIRDGSEMGDAAAAAGGMNAHQNYNLSSYREQHSSSNTSQQQKGMCKPHGATSCQQSLAFMLISPALGYIQENPTMHCSNSQAHLVNGFSTERFWEFQSKIVLRR